MACAASDIPLEARIVSCCDAFNAMTTTRSYRRAMPVSAALAELVENAGTQFDTQVVDALVRVIGQSARVSSDPGASHGTQRLMSPGSSAGAGIRNA